MVEYDDDSIGVGCVLVLRVRGTYDGELSIEELEDIDEQMEVVESGRNFSERIDVNTTSMEKHVSVEYAVQKSISAKALSNKEDRLDAFTVLEDPFIVIDVTTVEFIDRGD